MRKWIIVLALLLSFAACQKPYQTKIELGVNNEKIALPSFEQGHCFLTVFSNGSWTIAIEPAAEWASLDKSSGEGIGYVKFSYGENVTPDERSATVVVRGQGKECKTVITQPAE